ncbi:hypothetical protein EDD86DRAFT_225170 [Gorgonomyces haynaldii]|nr:hypothetical protein EDD86DRAFT_225170 [Gorgonomyces haynaldii]
MPFDEFCLNHYFKSVGWKRDRQFGSVCDVPNRILQFQVPNNLVLQIGKPISPYLSSAFTLVSQQGNRSFGYMFQSVPMDLPKRQVKEEDLEVYKPFERSYLLAGKIYEDATLEATMVSHLSPNWMLIGSGVSSWNETAEKWSNAQLQTIYSNSLGNADLTLSTDHQLVGFSFLTNIDHYWSVGSELYYTHKEKSGGLSFAAKYQRSLSKNVEAILTMIASPIMGHFSWCYCTTVRPNVMMAARYDLNVYSYESDLSFGLEYSHEKGEALKIGVGTGQGLSLRYDGIFQNALYSVGMSTQFGSQSGQTLGIQIEL